MILFTDKSKPVERQGRKARGLNTMRCMAAGCRKKSIFYYPAAWLTRWPSAYNSDHTGSSQFMHRVSRISQVRPEGGMPGKFKAVWENNKKLNRMLKLRGAMKHILYMGT